MKQIADVLLIKFYSYGDTLYMRNLSFYCEISLYVNIVVDLKIIE